jgi:TP901 family phage tail tape measure protein
MGSLNRLVTIFSANTAGFTAATKKMQRNMLAFKASVMASGKAINSAMNRIALGAGISAGLMIKHYAEFEKRMASVAAITGATEKQFGSLTKMAKRMGRTTIFTATQAAEAQEVMAMAGLSTKEIMMALGPALQLAAVGEVEIAQAAEIAAKTMRGMGLSAEDLYRVNNVLAGALVSSTTNMTQLGDALKYVAPLAAATNTSIEDTVAMIGKLSSAGFQGEMAGTGLRQAMAKLAGSTPHATKVLGDFGIQTVDSANNMLPMFDIIFQMEQQALSAGQIFEIFGARAGPQMLALLAVGAEGLAEYSLTLEEANEKMLAAEIEQKKLNTIWGAWKLMISAVSGVIIDSSESIAQVIRRVQAQFVAFFDNLDNRARIIEAVSSFMESFIMTLQNLMVWLNANSEGVMEFVSSLGAILGWVFDFLAAHPQLMAALIALKVAGLFGLTQAATALGRALVHLVVMVFPQLTGALAALRTGIQAVTAGISGFAVAIGTMAIGAFVIGLGAIKMAQADVNAEVERGIRLLNQLRNAQMRSIDADTRKALKIKDGEERLKALGKIQETVEGNHKNAEMSIAAERKQLQQLTQKRVDYEKKVREEFGVTLGDIELWMRTSGIGKVGEEYTRLLQAEEASSKHLQDAIKNEVRAKRRVVELNELIEQQELRVKGEAGSPSGAGGAGGAGAAPGAGGMAGAGGFGGGGSGSVGNIDKAIADRIEAGRRTEEREQFGRPAAREGAELEKFLDMGPAKDELLDFMATLDGITEGEAAMMADIRGLAIEQGVEMADIDEMFRQEAMARLQRHHENIRNAEEVKALREVQQKAGSLTEQLAADPMSAAGGGGPLERVKQGMDLLTLALDTGMISAQGYALELAKVQTAYQTGSAVAKQLENVQYSEAEAKSRLVAGGMTFREEFLKLQKDFFAGRLNTSQYKFAIQALTQSMRDSTRAAKEEERVKKQAAAAQRARLNRMRKQMNAQRGGGRGGGGMQQQQPLGPAHPMDRLLAQLSMAQAKAQLLMPNKQAFGRSIAGHRLGDIRKRRQSFGQAMADVQHIQRLIGNMRMAMMRGPMMATPGFATLNDPGMVTQQQGAVTISLPNVTRMNNEEIASVSDRLDEYRSRQGRQVV